MEATLSTNQVICSHCEELVHRYAARCPYCQHDLTTTSLVSLPELHFTSPTSSLKDPASPADAAVSKITPFNQDVPHKFQSTPTEAIKSPQAAVIQPASQVKPQSILPSFNSAAMEPKYPVTASSQENLIKILFAIIGLLGGSFFAFFGLMLKMFSQNGRLVLEWNAETWPYYLFPALVLLVFGMATLSSGEQEAS